MKIVFYHAGCYDGLISAYIWSKYNKCDKYVPTQYGENIAELTKDNDVVFLDISFPIDMIVKFKSLVIFDHHVSRHNDLMSTKLHENAKVHYNENKCGAVLVSEYFNDINYFSYIMQQYDYWNWKSENDRCYFEYIRSLIDVNKPAVECFEILRFIESVDKDYAIDAGRITLRYIEDICKSYKPVLAKFGEHNVLQIEAKLYKTEIANYWLEKSEEKYDFIMVWSKVNNEFMVSLRSKKPNVIEVAKKYGGGGHLYAAGFKCKKLDFT